MRVCLISFSHIPDDPRVRRQADALAGRGHEVIAVGVAGGSSAPTGWRCHDIRWPSLPPVRRKLNALAVMSAGRVPRLAARVASGRPRSMRLERDLLGLCADVYHANDWPALPFAARAAAAVGGRYVYDSHEYGVEQGLDRWRWRLVYPGYVRALERRYIGGAAFVSTVGEGIAELLRRDYGLGRRPLVIRNVPAYQAMPMRVPGASMTVLYHGAFGTNRGLEDLLRSVSLWRSEFRLVVRGFGPRAYVEHLRRVARESAAADRIEFVAPVPMLALVAEANRADIGVHAIPATSSQTRFSLPNKFFEYVMAGLAVCVTDLPEMGRLVRRHDLGRTIAGGGPAAIAAAINGFTRESVSAYKANALEAARELCWERERDVLLNAYDQLETATTS